MSANSVFLSKRNILHQNRKIEKRKTNILSKKNKIFIIDKIDEENLKLWMYKNE